MNPTPLQEWAEANDPSKTGLIYKDGFWKQIIFVRDQLRRIVYDTMCDGNCDATKKVEDSLCVISTHMSKSVVLPVFHVTLPDGTECVMRYNFHDWKVSVKAPRDVQCDFVGLIDEVHGISGSYCEGFPSDWVFGPYGENQKEFTVALPSRYEVFTFFWLLTASLAKQRQAVAA